MRKVLPLLGCALLAGCGARDGEAKEAVRALLRDPESAQFRDVQPCDKPGAVRGDVNAKNAYGGYTGFQPFIFVSGQGAAILGEGADLQRWEALRAGCWSDEILKKTTSGDDVGAVDNLSAPAPSPAG